MARRGRIKRSLIALAMTAVMGATYTPASHALFFGGIVYDPTNYVQNFQTAVHNYSQLIRQAQQLRNEAQMLINQAKNLTRLDVNLARDIDRILGEIDYLYAQAENVAYEVDRTRALVKQNFPEDYRSLTQNEIYQKAEAQYEMARTAYNDSMIMQSQMVQNLQEDRIILAQMMDESHGSEGELQATQSTNQLVGLLVKQSMQSQQLQIAQSRADSIEAARNLAIARESAVRNRRFLGRAGDAYSGTP